MNKQERVELIIKAYTQDKKTCTDISREFKIQRKSVYKILDRHKIALREKVTKSCNLCDTTVNENTRVCGPCSTNIRRFKLRQKAVLYKGGKCNSCGWSGDVSGFDFHHTNPLEKDFEISAKIIASKKWQIIQTELDKCVLLCAICHRLEHTNYNNEFFAKEALLFKEI